MEKILENVKRQLEDKNTYKCLECGDIVNSESCYIEINSDGNVYKTCRSCKSEDLEIVNK